MAHELDVFRIIADSFCPFKFRRGRRFSFRHFCVSFVLPAALGAWQSFRHPAIDSKYQVGLFAAFGAVAAVLTAILPVIQYLVGLGLPEHKYKPSEFLAWEAQVVRLEVVRELYSSISTGVILLVFSGAPILALQFDWLPATLKQLCSALIFFVGFAVAISFLQIITGVYDVLEHQAKEIDDKLDKISPDDQ